MRRAGATIYRLRITDRHVLLPIHPTEFHASQMHATALAPCAFATERCKLKRSKLVKPALRDDRGFLHSMQTGSVVDGPGMRTVIWTTGCLLRCLYCHNPDTWHMKDGKPVTIDDVMSEVGKYEKFMAITNGGVTISGGEPMVQAPFVARILRECRKLGIHTALDTNGFLTERFSDEDFESVDLVLLDIKSWLDETHLRATGRPVKPVLDFARRLERLGQPTWIRLVLVPGLTDGVENVDGLARFVSSLSNVERVEVLPFHQMGARKWEALEKPYPLKNTMPPSPELIERVLRQFRDHGVEAYC